MSTNYLDSNGLLYLWGKIKDRFVAKETNKGLSSNDYTDAEKAKLLNIESGAEVNVQADWNQTVTTADDYIKNKPSIPAASSTTPSMDGTAAVGTGTTWARADHVHPSDTSRVPTTRTVNGHALSSNVTVTNADLGQGYATCTTAADTTAKTVTLSGYLLTAGGIIAVKFSYATNSGIYTLNVNSKGAKAVMYNGTAATSSAPIKLPFCRRTGVTYYFVYDGTNYVYIGSDQETVYFGSCSTGASTAEKTADCAGFTGLADCLVVVAFGQGNSATPITLNINGLGAKNVIFPQSNGATSTDASKFNGYGAYMFEYTYDGGILGAYKYVGSLGVSYNNATSSADGLMSSSDKSKLDSVDQNADHVFYGSCLTLTSQQDKVVTCSDYSLKDGRVVVVTFSQGNSAASITLNINDTGSKTVYFGGETAASTDATRFKGSGTYWFICRYVQSSWRYYFIGVLDTTYTNASTSTAGLMSSADKTKLNKLVFDSNNLISSSILPSYVDDVIEAYARSGQTALSSTWLATESASGTVITPETGKIYILMSDSGDYVANTQFRWGGSTYVMLSDSSGISSITNAEIDTIVAT